MLLVLFVTTSAYCCNQLGKELRKRESPELWLMVDHHDLTPESFLLKPIPSTTDIDDQRRFSDAESCTSPTQD